MNSAPGRQRVTALKRVMRDLARGTVLNSTGLALGLGGDLKLRQEDIRAAQVRDPVVHEMIGRISVFADPSLDARGHTAADLTLATNDGKGHRRGLDIAPGFPGADLDDTQHLARFRDCLAYAPRTPGDAQIERLLAALHGLTGLKDARELVPLLTAR